jgi:hypothetical protein
MDILKANKGEAEKPEKDMPPGRDQWKPWMGPLLLLLLTLLMLGGVFMGGGAVVSRLGADLSSQFLAWRDFGFGELGKGRLPLWNPYLFSGIPYLGGFQAAMLYPPNLLHVLLPLGVAINLLVALHIFLSGLFMYFWALRRGLHWMAATTAGALLMFCGAQFLHVYAGHLPNLSGMAWAPLLFLALDGFLGTRQAGWCLLGMAVMAMQILAGHPQYVFYTGVAAGLYFCFRVVKKDRRLALGAGFAAIFAGAAALSAVQLLPGLDASSESIRSQGLPYQFAAMFSLPPENLLTLVAPNFFGNMIAFPYWGRWHLWEMSLFMGVTGLVLAVYGSIRGNKHLRLFSLPMAVILLVLALGAHTPLFKFLYDYIPGFDKFRGNSKFIFQASLFLAMLAGVGLDTLLKEKRNHLWLVVWIVTGAVTILGLGLALGSGAVNNNPAQWWRGVMNAVLATGESYLPGHFYSRIEFVSQAAGVASRGMFVAAGTLALLAGLVSSAKRWRLAGYGIATLAMLEVFIFARSSLVTFDLATARLPQLQRFLEERPGDYRVLNLINPNIAMLTGKGDLWGDDPGVSLRYAQFMAFTQMKNPDKATQYLPFNYASMLYRMLRLRYVFVPEEGKGALGLEDREATAIGRLQYYGSEGPWVRVFEAKQPLARLQLIHDYEVLSGRDRIFAAMSGDFDPEKKVILEVQPQPAPQKNATGNGSKVRITDSSTDHMTIQADLTSPAILLITDGYSKDWRARALDGSVQMHYQVMPANYVLMAVPLTAGHHHFRLEYAPRSFEIGKWISIVSLAGFLAAVAWLWRSKRKGGTGKYKPQSAQR